MTEPLLRVRGLARTVPGRTLFSDLDLDLGPGEAVVVQGPSGRGKTSLLRLLAWLDLPSAGEITLEGRPPRAWGVPRWRAMVAYIAQDPPVLPGTPRAHAAAIGALGAQHMDDPLPLVERLGVLDRWDRPWTELSGGERQRAHLAIALATRPKVLLLDEPTSALDPDATAIAEALLAPFARVWVTHDASQATRQADRVVTL